MELLNEKQHTLLVKLRRIPRKLALGKHVQIYFHQKIIIPILRLRYIIIKQA